MTDITMWLLARYGHHLTENEKNSLSNREAAALAEKRQDQLEKKVRAEELRRVLDWGKE